MPKIKTCFIIQKEVAGKQANKKMEHGAKRSFYLAVCAFLGMVLFLLLAAALNLILALWYVYGYGAPGFSAQRISQFFVWSLLAGALAGAWYGVWLGLHWYEWVYGEGLGRGVKFVWVLRQLAAHPGTLPQKSFRLLRASRKPGSGKSIINLPWQVEDLLEQSGLVASPPPPPARVKVVKRRGRPKRLSEK